jgi:hypothetical protein
MTFVLRAFVNTRNANYSFIVITVKVEKVFMVSAYRLMA